MAVAPAIGGTDLSYGLSRTQRERLQSATDLAVFHGSVVRLRLLNFDGTAFFSDDGSLSGDGPGRRPGVPGRDRRPGRRPRSGRPADGSPASIRVLQPVIAGANGQAMGVLEVVAPLRRDRRQGAGRHQPDDPAARRSASSACTPCCAGISWWSTRTLRRHAANHEHQALHDPLTGLPNRELFRRTRRGVARRGAGPATRGRWC